MRWDHLTSKDMATLDKEETVVLVPVGSIEVHGPHLPLGTDTLAIYEVCLRAAEKTESLLVPPISYAYVPENRHFPGTITLSGEAFLRLLEEVCDEIYRNGFRKVFVVNGHGGNIRPLSLFLRDMQAKGKRYLLYILMEPWILIQDVIREVLESQRYGHACEIETSYMMFLHPYLCKLRNVTKPADLGPEKIVENVETMADWIGYAVEGYVGDPRKATAEKGRKIFNTWVERLAAVVESIKRDEIYEKVIDSYYSRIYHQ